MKYLFVLLLLISITPVFGESHPEFFGIDAPSFYELRVDTHDFIIPYHVDAKVLAMAVDQELNSLLIGLEDTKDSIMIIDLDHKLISAENNDFAVLVNGLEVDYDITSDADSSTLIFFVSDYTEEVEIIGTHVIPEFPIGFLIIFAVIMSSIVLFSKIKIPIFKL